MKYIGIIEFPNGPDSPATLVKWFPSIQAADKWLAAKAKEFAGKLYMRCTVAECLLTIEN